MSVNSAQERSKIGQWDKADEVDISRYVNGLWRRWPEILLVTVATILITLVGVWAYRTWTPPVYESTATAAIVRTSTDVRFDERFTTSSDQPNMDVNSRRAALVALVKSGSIAQQVIKDLGGQLSPSNRSPATLLDAVTGEMATVGGRVGQSDLINITVRALSPEQAALIANAWANAYVQQVNRVYGQVPDDMLGSVNAQLTEAQQTYAVAQEKLETHLATSRLDALVRQSDVLSETLTVLNDGQVNALNAYIDGLVASYKTIVDTYLTAQSDNQVLAFSKEQEGRRARMAAIFDAYNAAQVDTITGQNDRNRSQLRMYYDQWLRTNSLLAAARTLNEQVNSSTGMDATSTALALQVLQVQMVNAAAVAPPTLNTSNLTENQLKQQQLLGGTQQGQQPTTILQLQLDGAPTVNSADLKAQVDATVASLETQLVSLEDNIARLSQDLASGDNIQALNTGVPADSALAKSIMDSYPELFQTGIFSTTNLQQGENDTLLAAGQAQADLFMSLAGSDYLPTSDSPNAPMAATIARLDEQMRMLQGQIEVENARTLEFTEQRDLAWESVQALSNKQAELQLARAAANSEVRLSSLAVPLDEPIARADLLASVALAAAGGFLLGLVIALILELIGVRPLRGYGKAATPA